MGADGKTPMRIKDVYYWYIDYRELADVVKYRIAMMRRGIDDKVKQVSLFPFTKSRFIISYARVSGKSSF